MTNRYAWAFAALGFALSIVAIVTILFGLKVIDLRNELRTRDQADDVQKVANCRGSILGSRIVSVVIGDLREDYDSRAATSRALAKVDLTDAERRIHLQAARTAEQKSAALARIPSLFPRVTAKQCDALAKSLGVS